MGIKKKLGLGIGAAALGLSLVGGGTFAYFNDTASINNQFAAGTLNLDVQKDPESAVNFDLRNLKPGDNATRYFVLANGGSLSIKDVLMKVGVTDFVDGMVAKNKASDSNVTQYLSQFKVDFFRVQNPDPSNVAAWGNQANLIIGNVTLADIVAGTYTGINPSYVSGTSLNISPTGLPVGDKDGVAIKITFVDSGNQNIYQGDSAKVQFNLTAEQEAGVEVKSNGYINSNANHPSTPVTTNNGDNKDLSSSVTDATDNPNE
jgi:spore coat-associated protein N